MRLEERPVGNENRAVAQARKKTSVARFATVIGFAFVLGAFSILSPVFLTLSNLMDVLRQVSILGIIAFGLTMPMITGRFDISLGFFVDVISVLVAGAMSKGIPAIVAVFYALAVGGVFGMVKGWLIAHIGISDFICTLAVGGISTGIAFMYTKGYPIVEGMPKGFLKLAEGYVGFVPFPVIILAAVFALLYVFLYRSRYGRYLYAIGGNEEAAHLSGINTKGYILMAYTLCSICVALAGVIYTSRLASGQPIGGDGFMLDAIASVFIGMTTFMLGEANLPGTLLGVLLIGVLNNGLTLLNVEYYFQDILKGVIIIVAVTLTAVQRRRKKH